MCVQKGRGILPTSPHHIPFAERRIWDAFLHQNSGPIEISRLYAFVTIYVDVQNESVHVRKFISCTGVNIVNDIHIHTRLRQLSPYFSFFLHLNSLARCVPRIVINTVQITQKRYYTMFVYAVAITCPICVSFLTWEISNN